MKKVVTAAAVLSAVGTAVCLCLYKGSGSGTMFAAAITFGTTAYHLLMRLCVGFAFDKWMKNRADPAKRWYQIRAWERRLYERIHVKRWKGAMPTYDSTLFDHTKKRWEEIAQASCQAELVHETIILLSFVPMFFARWFGALPTFAVTSVFAALFDLTFVVIQRYNRPRTMRLIERRVPAYRGEGRTRGAEHTHRR